MKTRYYLYSAVIIAILLALVFFSEQRASHYRISVEDAHEIFTNADPAISREEAEALGPELLQVEIIAGVAVQEDSNYIAIPLADLSDPEFVKRLRKHKGPVAIIADDYSLSAPAWLILIRMGISNIWILDVDDDEK